MQCNSNHGLIYMFLCFMENYSSFPPILHIKQYLHILFDSYTFEISQVSKMKIFINCNFVPIIKENQLLGYNGKGQVKRHCFLFPITLPPGVIYGKPHQTYQTPAGDPSSIRRDLWPLFATSCHIRYKKSGKGSGRAIILEGTQRSIRPTYKHKEMFGIS